LSLSVPSNFDIEDYLKFALLEDDEAVSDWINLNIGGSDAK